MPAAAARDAFRPLRLYARFRGRSARREFWGFQLLVLIVIFAIEAAFRLVGLPFLGMLAALFFLLPSLAVGALRLHDTGRRGCWLLLPWSALLTLNSAAMVSGNVPDLSVMLDHVLIEVILASLAALAAAVLLLFAWFAAQGNPGPNRFGPDPLGTTDIAAIFS